ncbi:MAG: PAS domain-containing protein [Proteobacteria bacterium]|nr:PAS domain-containing protein [Pseudomonadota bacterium]
MLAWKQAKKHLDVPSPLRDDLDFDDLGPALPNTFILSTDTYGTEFEFVGENMRHYFGSQLYEGQKLHALFRDHRSWDKLSTILRQVVHDQDRGKAKVHMPANCEPHNFDMIFLPMRHGPDGEINRILGLFIPVGEDKIPKNYRLDPKQSPSIGEGKNDVDLTNPQERLAGPLHFLETTPEEREAIAWSENGRRTTPFKVFTGGVSSGPSPMRPRIMALLEASRREKSMP